jgi:hypothetical protein
MKFFLFYCLSITFLFSAKDRFLSPQNYDVWFIEEPSMKEMIYKEINRFVSKNPEDSLNDITFSDRIIIIESKKQENLIYELRYGQGIRYQFIDNKLINWVLPEKLRTEITDKDYFFISDQKYLNNINENLESEYFHNHFHWTNTDIHVSFGSSFILDRFIYRPTKINGRPISSSSALSIRLGNDLIGYPSHSKGMIDIGVLSTNYEIGIQTPIIELIDEKYSHYKFDKKNQNNYLQGGIGGYGKVLLLNQFQFQLSFSEMIEEKLFLNQIRDSTFIDFLSLSTFLGYDFNFNKPILGLGYMKGMLGVGYYEISHKTLTSEEKFIERYESKNASILSNSKSSFIGAMARADLITNLKRKTLPITHFYVQVNGYKGNSSWQSGLNFNVKSLGIDLIYKQSLDKVDWAPNQEVFISFNYNVNL